MPLIVARRSPLPFYLSYRFRRSRGGAGAHYDTSPPPHIMMTPTFDVDEDDDEGSSASTSISPSIAATTAASNKSQHDAVAIQSTASIDACSHDDNHDDRHHHEMHVSSNKTLQKKSVRIDESKNVSYDNVLWHKDECKSRWYTRNNYRSFRLRKRRHDQVINRIEQIYEMIDQCSSAFMLANTCQGDLSMGDMGLQTMQVTMI